MSGCQLRGGKQHPEKYRLFIPDLLFDTHIEMGENVVLYRGDMAECYVLY